MSEKNTAKLQVFKYSALSLKIVRTRLFVSRRTPERFACIWRSMGVISVRFEKN